MDHNSGKLICCNVDGENKILSIDCKNGAKKVLTSNGKFWGFNEDRIYFQDFDAVKNKDAMEGSVTLKSIKSTGKDKATLAITKPDLYKDSSKCLCQITQIQIEEDSVYFSYGGYSGTAGFYQGGIIARVSKNGTDYKVLAGKDDNIPSGKFYIKNTKSGKHLIYLISGNDNSPTVSINLKNGDKKQTDFLVYKRGEPFKDGSYVSMYLDNSGKKSILLKKIDYEDMGDYAQLREEMGETYFRIYDVETVHNKVYYTAEFSKHNSKLDSGWKYGYDRIKTNVYCKDIDTAKKKLLYSY